MASITLDIDDALLLGYSKKVAAKGEKLCKNLERLLVKKLMSFREDAGMKANKVVESFHLRGDHREIPGDEMGKNAVAKQKYLP